MNLHLETAIVKKEAILGVVKFCNSRALFYTRKAFAQSLISRGLNNPLSLKQGFQTQAASPSFNQRFSS